MKMYEIGMQVNTQEDILDMFREERAPRSDYYVMQENAKNFCTVEDVLLEMKADSEIYGVAEVEENLDSLQLYLREINAIPLLDHWEVEALAQRMEMGDEDARDKLIRANLRLVVFVAKQYNGKSKLSLQDLIEEGNLGLIKAAQTYNWVLGYKFSTYATRLIRQAITRAIANYGRTIRIPENMLVEINKLRVGKAKLRQEIQKEPSVEELAAWMLMPVKKVEELLDAAQVVLSIDMAAGEDETYGITSFVADEQAAQPEKIVIMRQLTAAVRTAMMSLSNREEQILCLRYGMDGGPERTLDEVGSMLGISRERTRQIEQKALKKLRHPANVAMLRAYCG